MVKKSIKKGKARKNSAKETGEAVSDLDKAKINNEEDLIEIKLDKEATLSTKLEKKGKKNKRKKKKEEIDDESLLKKEKRFSDTGIAKEPKKGIGFQDIINVFSNFSASLRNNLPKAGIDKTPVEYLKSSFFPWGIITILMMTIIGVILINVNLVTPPVGVFIILSAPFIFFGIVFMYPKWKANSRGSSINDALPLLIVYMGGISTSQISRDDLFRLVSLREKYFGIAAKEIARIRTIAVDWNVGYLDAMKVIAHTSPSHQFSDFLIRFAQSLNSGEPLSSFFQKEQQSTLNAYMNNYRRSIKSLEMLGDAFNAILMSLVFLAVTILTMTYVFGFGAMTDMLMIILLLVSGMVLGSLTLAFNTVGASDPLRIKKSKSPETEKITQFILVFGLSSIVWGLLVLLLSLPFPLFIIGFGMLLYPISMAANSWEEVVVSRDDNFPVFVRSLGGIATSIGGSLVKAISYITQQEFGTLSGNISQLYARYQFGISPEVAWDRFCWETNSNLIQKYTRLYVEATSIGGSPHEVGRFVSDNVEKILELRRDKGQIIDSLKGSLTPMIFVVAALMIFMSETLNMLGDILDSASSAGGPGLAMGRPPDPGFLALYFGGLILILPLFSGLAVAFPKQTHLATATGFMSRSYIILGVEIIIVEIAAKGMFANFGM